MGFVGDVPVRGVRQVRELESLWSSEGRENVLLFSLYFVSFTISFLCGGWMKIVVRMYIFMLIKVTYACKLLWPRLSGSLLGRFINLIVNIS